jgi:transcriptional repressor NrdR
MRCPYCHEDRDRVVDSRSAAEGTIIRRRRECEACGRRFTTYEEVEASALRVVKKDGSRVPFDRAKILAGLLKACEKRAVSTEQLEAVVKRIEGRLYDRYDKEVTTRAIGEEVMDELRGLDQVAYVRFASVYREFKDVTEFMEEIKRMLARETERPGGGPSEGGEQGSREPTGT